MARDLPLIPPGGVGVERSLMFGLLLFLSFGPFIAWGEEDPQSNLISEEEQLRDAENYSSEMESFFKKGRVDRAVRSYRKALKTYKSLNQLTLLQALDDLAYVKASKIGSDLAFTLEAWKKEGQDIIHQGMKETDKVGGQGMVNDGMRMFDDALLLARMCRNDAWQISVLNLLAETSTNQEMYSKGIGFYKQVVEFDQKQKDDKKLSTDLLKLADLYRLVGRLGRAEDLAVQAVALKKKLKDAAGEAEGNRVLATAYLYSGEIGKATPLLIQGLDAMRGLKNKAGEAAMLKGLGDVEKYAGEYQRALDLYDQALKLYQSLNLKNDEGWTQIARGEVLKAQGRDDDAVDALIAAATAFKETGKVSGIVAVKQILGLYYLEEGQTQEAVKLFKESLALNEKVAHAGRQARDLYYLGQAYAAQKSWESSVDYYERALQIQHRLLDSDEWQSDVAVAESYKRNAQLSEALDSYQNAIHHVEALRGKVAGEELRGAFFGRKLLPYHRAVSAYFDLYSTTGKNVEFAKKAFHFAERAKARSLLEQLASKRVQFGQHLVSAEVLKEEDRVRGIAMELQGEIFELASQGKGVDELEQKREDLKLADDAVVQFVRKLRVTNPLYANLKYPEPYEVSALPLAKGETLIEYFVTPEATFVWVVDSDGDKKKIKSFHKISIAALELECKIRWFRLPFEHPGLTADPMFDPLRAKELYDLLLVPLIKDIPAGSQLMLVPDGILHILPFGCLVTENPLSLASDAGAKLTKPSSLRGITITTKNVAKTTTPSLALPPRGGGVGGGDDGFSAETQKALEEIGQMLTSPERKEDQVLIIGYTDDRGDGGELLKRSLDLAKKARKFLGDKFGITEDRLAVDGFGASCPFVANDTEANRMKNRRLEFVVLSNVEYAKAAPRRGITIAAKKATIPPPSGPSPARGEGQKVSSPLVARDLPLLPPGKGGGEATVKTTILQKPSFGVPPGAYLADKWRISTYQSSSILALARSIKNPAIPTRTLFAVGDAVFSEQDEDAGKLRGITIKAKNTAPSLTLPPGGGGMGGGEHCPPPYSLGIARLVNTHKEVLTISEALGQVVKAPDVLLRGEVKESAVKRAPLAEYRYLHFATHGMLSDQIPCVKEPALLMCLLGNEDGQDGLLTMSEVLGLKLNAELVVLSACQTGLGKAQAGEGIVGLSRAFMLAGTQSMMVSLWEIDDAASSTFMQTFYRTLKAGKSKAEAMSEARTAVMKGGDTNPFYWAPFMLVGEWR